jgi:hypothetical protein
MEFRTRGVEAYFPGYVSVYLLAMTIRHVLQIASILRPDDLWQGVKVWPADLVLVLIRVQYMS